MYLQKEAKYWVLKSLKPSPSCRLTTYPKCCVTECTFSQPVVLSPFTFVLLSTSRSPWSLFMQPLEKPYEIVPGGPCVSWLSVTRRENVPASHLFKQNSAIEKINVDWDPPRNQIITHARKKTNAKGERGGLLPGPPHAMSLVPFGLSPAPSISLVSLSHTDHLGPQSPGMGRQLTEIRWTGAKYSAQGILKTGSCGSETAPRLLPFGRVGGTAEMGHCAWKIRQEKISVFVLHLFFSLQSKLVAFPYL